MTRVWDVGLTPSAGPLPYAATDRECDGTATPAALRRAIDHEGLPKKRFEAVVPIRGGGQPTAFTRDDAGRGLLAQVLGNASSGGVPIPAVVNLALTKPRLGASEGLACTVLL